MECTSVSDSRRGLAEGGEVVVLLLPRARALPSALAPRSRAPSASTARPPDVSFRKLERRSLGEGLPPPGLAAGDLLGRRGKYESPPLRSSDVERCSRCEAGVGPAAGGVPRDCIAWIDRSITLT